MAPLDALASLKDIDGVYGSFVIDRRGIPTHRDLPTLISNAALTEAGPRIARLWAGFPPGDTAEAMVLSFASHQLFVKKLSAGSLCVFAPPSVNRLALNMVAGLVGSHLEPELEAAGSTVQDSAASAATATTPPPSTDAPSAPESGRKTIVYRGQRYEV
jgi:hypothetical protein